MGAGTTRRSTGSIVGTVGAVGGGADLLEASHVHVKGDDGVGSGSAGDEGKQDRAEKIDKPHEEREGGEPEIDMPLQRHENVSLA